MPKDWGEKWKRHFIPKPQDVIMNKSLPAIIAVIVVGTTSVFAISPYFTESAVDEANTNRCYHSIKHGERSHDGENNSNALCWNIHRCW